MWCFNDCKINCDENKFLVYLIFNFFFLIYTSKV